MDDLDGQYTLLDDSRTEKWCDIAREIESGKRMLRETFDFDIVGLQAYLDRVAQVGPLPCCGVQQWAEEDLDAAGGTFTELVNTFPLKPESLMDNDRVFRRKWVLFCMELLKAEAALKTGLTDKAWWHWSHARSYEGQAEGYYLLAKPAEDKRRSGQKGGIVKEAKKRQAVLDACITQLEKLRPSSGWKSPDAAIKAVLPEVKAELKAQLRKQSKEIDVFALLFVWLNGESKVQQAGGFKMECTKE